MQHQHKDLTLTLDEGSAINAGTSSEYGLLQASQAIHWEIAIPVTVAVSAFCVWQSAELLLVMIGVPFGAWVLQPSRVTDMLDQMKTNIPILYGLLIWELLIFCVATQVCCVELFVVASAVPLGICALLQFDAMKPQTPCNSKGDPLKDMKQKMSMAAEPPEDRNLDCEQLYGKVAGLPGEQEIYESENENLENNVEEQEEMCRPEELDGTDKDERKVAEESEEPSTIGDLPDETAAEKVEQEDAEPVSPSNRLDWAAISEFSELEELPMGPIRPRPKLSESRDSPCPEGIPEHQAPNETAMPQAPAEKASPKTSAKATPRNVKGSQQSSRAQLLAFASGEAQPADKDDKDDVIPDNEEEEQDETSKYVKKCRRNLAHAFQNHDYHSAEHWMVELEKQGEADAVKYNMIMNLCIKKKDRYGASKWMKRMQDHGVQADIASYNSIIHASAQAGDVRGAEKWLETMRAAGMKPNKITLNAVISACAQAGDQQRAQYWMGQFGTEGLSADVVSFGAMINACAKQGDAKGAVEWLEQMLNFGVEANNVTYGAVITACARSGDRKGAEHWFKTMCDHGIQPDRVCYNILIDTCAKAKDPDAAEAYLDQMIASGTLPDTRTYNALMNACAKAKDSVRAERLLGEMFDQGIHADVISYSTVINACASTGQVQNAAKWLTQMLKEGIAANVQSYSTVVSAFARKGNVKGAEQWLMRMTDAGVKGDTIAYTAVINACGTVGDVAKAEAWLVEMLEKGVEPNVVSFNAVIAACTKSNNGEKAMEWLEKMRQCGVPPNSFSYNLAVKPFVNRGDVKTVERLFDVAQKKDRLPWDDFVLASLIRVYTNTRHKQPEKAEEAFYTAVQCGVRPSHTTMTALASLVGKPKADSLLKYAREQNPYVEGEGTGDAPRQDKGKGKGKGKNKGKGKGKFMEGLMPNSSYQ